jgi:hypothetical protein
MRLALILLAWKRPEGTLANLKDLNDQTMEGFHIVVSNSNPEIHDKLAKYVSQFKDLDINLRLDSNDRLAFRRITIAHELAKQGFDAIMFLDDDIRIPKNYVELAIEQFEEKTYKSNYTWKFLNGGVDYYKQRTRVYEDDPGIRYCGTAVSIIDARVFLNEAILHPPEGAIAVEDLWLSYFAHHVAGYQLKYLNIPKVIIGGGDAVALYRQVSRQDYTKKDLLLDLIATGWSV